MELINKSVNKYVKINKLLVKKLKILKKENNILIFIFLSKIFMISKY